MVANIGRPGRDQAGEAPPVVGEQRARGLLEIPRLPAIADMK